MVSQVDTFLEKPSVPVFSPLSTSSPEAITAKRKQAKLIRGTATHRRTESDYMGVLLDAVTLDDWLGVISGHVKRGCLCHRAHAGAYL